MQPTQRIPKRSVKLILAGTSFAFALMPALAADQSDDVPMWAYPTAPPGAKPTPDDGMPLKMP